MKTAKFFSSLTIGLLLAACGGGNNTTLTQATGSSSGGSGGGGATAAAIAVTSNAAAILSDGSTTATITAIAFDSNHVLLPGVAITLAADTGVLAPYPAATDSTGTLTSTLATGGNPTIRTITVTASAAGVAPKNVQVQVIAKGSSAPVFKLTVTADTPTILSDGSQVANITAYALDASNNLLPNVPVLFSADNPAITATNPTTNASGAATAVVSTGGIPTLRTINVTACTGTCPGPVSASVPVQVVAGSGSVTVQMGSPAGAGFVPNVIAASSLSAARVRWKVSWGISPHSTRTSRPCRP
jgi:adhesin/invasin